MGVLVVLSAICMITAYVSGMFLAPAWFSLLFLSGAAFLMAIVIGQTIFILNRPKIRRRHLYLVK